MPRIMRRRSLADLCLGLQHIIRTAARAIRNGRPAIQAGLIRDTRTPATTDGLSAAAAGYSVDQAIENANLVNKTVGVGKTLPKVNENAIRKAYQDYEKKRFLDPNPAKGEIYVRATQARDYENYSRMFAGSLSHRIETYLTPKRTDVERRSVANGDDMDDWYTRWIKPLIQQ